MDIGPLGWASLASPVGCVIFLFIALARGWLTAARDVDRLTKQWEDRLEEAHVREQTWQKAALVSEETRRDVADQLRQLQAISEAQVKILYSLKNGN